MVHTTFLTDLNPFFEGDRSPEYWHCFALPFFNYFPSHRECL